MILFSYVFKYEFYASNYISNVYISGIGIDDMFLLMSGMAEAPSLREISVEEKMMIMLRNSGISITITSFTNLLAFGIGATSAFISIRNFCIYTGKI